MADALKPNRKPFTRFYFWQKIDLKNCCVSSQSPPSDGHNGVLTRSFNSAVCRLGPSESSRPATSAGFGLASGQAIETTDGDLFRLDKTCGKKMCPAVGAPHNGHGPVTTLETKSYSTAGSGSSVPPRSSARQVALGTLPHRNASRPTVRTSGGRFDCGPFRSS